jgi:hypothetical protein
MVAFKPSTHGQLLVVEENRESRKIESEQAIPLVRTAGSNSTSKVTSTSLLRWLCLFGKTQRWFKHDSVWTTLKLVILAIVPQQSWVHTSLLRWFCLFGKTQRWFKHDSVWTTLVHLSLLKRIKRVEILKVESDSIDWDYKYKSKKV